MKLKYRLRNIWYFITDILLSIVYSPVILLEYFEDSISTDYEYSEGDDNIRKRLIIYGVICLVIGIIIGVVITSIIN